MKKMLYGVQDMSFKTKEGDLIDGVKVHYLAKDNNVFGLCAIAKYIKRDVLNGWGLTYEDLKTMVNTEIDIEINEKGAICGLCV